MANLSSLLGKLSQVEIDEQNLEQAKIFVFATAQREAEMCEDRNVWISPGKGTAQIEIWGAAGSGSRMCCCGIGLPGNPGAYAKKIIRVNEDSWICGRMGRSCGNADRLCWRECSNGTCIRICTTEPEHRGCECMCMCAEGGMAGFALCGCCCCSMFGKFVNCQFCCVDFGSGCGKICNHSATYSWLPTAYGGDINWSPSSFTDGTGVSCLTMGHCKACCLCYYEFHVKVPPGIYGPEPQTVSYGAQPNGDKPLWNNSHEQYYMHLAGMRNMPNQGAPLWTCYSGNAYCGCYEYNGCDHKAPMGVPGHGTTPCAGVRDHGMRGGHGFMKIKFIPD